MPRRSTIAPPVRLAPLALLLAAACVRNPAPPQPAPSGPASSGAPATPVPVSPASPAAEVLRGGPWGFAYAPGLVSYVVTTDGAVTVEGDTSGTRSDSAHTRARLSYRLSPENAPLGVLVTVDSFFVSTRAGTPMQNVLQIPVVFQAMLDAAHSHVTFAEQQPMMGTPCAGPQETLLALAADLAPSLPPTLERGARWTERTTASTCRAGVPLTVESTHEWKVEGDEEQGGVRTVRLTRATRSRVHGTGTGRRTGASIDGESQVDAQLWVDPALGRVRALEATTRSDLRVKERADGPEIRVRQEGRTVATGS
jgi:hypothetical protein